MTTKTAVTSQNRCDGTIKIDPNYKLELVAAKSDQYRPAIENIKLGRSKRFGQCAVATNGRSMAIVPCELPDGDKAIDGLISPEALKASRKNKPLEGLMVLNGKIDLPAAQSFPRPLESEVGNYPRFEAVLPEQNAKFSIALNPQYLLDLAKAIGWTGGSLRLDFIDEMSPIVAHCKDTSEAAYGVLMPMRINT